MNELKIIKEGFHYGVADELDNILIEAKYDNIEFQEWCDIIKVRKFHKEGLFDGNCNVLVPCTYAEIDHLSKTFYAVRINPEGLWALFANGKEVSGFKYSTISYIYNTDLFIVKENNQFGIINSDGDLSLQCVFDSISTGTDQVIPYICTTKDSKNQYYDLGLHTLLCISEEEISTHKVYGTGPFIHIKNGKYGAYMPVKDGCIEILPPIYNNLKFFGYLGDTMDTASFVTRDENDGCRLIRANGSYVFNRSFEDLNYYRSKGIAFKKDGLWGVFGNSLNIIISPKYADIKAVNNNSIVASLDGTKYGIDTFEGKNIIPHVYPKSQIESLSPYFSRKYRDYYRVNDKCGAIDSKGNITVPFFFDSLDERGIVSVNNRYGLYRDGVGLVAQCVFDKITITYNNLFIVGLDEKKGLMSSDGTVIVPIEFDDVHSSPGQDESAFVVVQLGREGIYTVDFGLTCSCDFDSIKPTHFKDVFIATSNGSMSIIDSTGQTTIDCHFSNVNVYDTGVITAELNGYCFHHIVNDCKITRLPLAYKNGNLYKTNGYNIVESTFYRLMVGYNHQNLPEYFIVADAEGRVGYLDRNCKFTVDASKPRVRPIITRPSRYSTYVINYIDWNGLKRSYSTVAETEQDARDNFWDSGVSWEVYIESVRKI